MRVTVHPRRSARPAWARPLAAMLAVANLALPTWAQSPPGGAAPHPIWGTWKMTLDDGICAETYHFRKDGTTVVTSGTEVTESSYSISPAPSARGYYRLFDRITRTNGKPDCTGKVTQSGREATTYVRVHPSGEMIIFCDSESLDNCFGPLKRIPDEEM